MNGRIVFACGGLLMACLAIASVAAEASDYVHLNFWGGLLVGIVGTWGAWSFLLILDSGVKE